MIASAPASSPVSLRPPEGADVTRSRCAMLALGLAAALVLGTASAYPDKPIQYIIPFAPGGESDITARMQAQVFAAKYKDRKSTRLNSSHVAISYAVFCLK